MDMSLYRKYHGNASFAGKAKKNNSDVIMEQTWWEDVDAQVAYIYDYYHDDQPLSIRGLNSANSETKIPVDIKYKMNAHQTYNKDQVTFHIQFRPSHKCELDYYYSYYEKIYDSLYPLGLYIDIMDNNGNYNKWLIVDKADYYSDLFTTFEVLPCDYVFKWVHNNTRYQMSGCLRSQNSYNSGVWIDFKIQSPEDQQKFIVPLNRDSETLFYNQRMIIDANVLTEPRAWKITKVNRISPNGLNRLTLAQDRFDQHKDYIEKNSDGDVIGMWADYYQNDIEPMPEIFVPKTEGVNIIYSGKSPVVKIGGSYKTLSIVTSDGDDVDTIGSWSFTVDGNDVSEFVQIITSDNSETLKSNQIKIKFVGSYDYFGKILLVNNDASDNPLELEIAGL